MSRHLSSIFLLVVPCFALANLSLKENAAMHQLVELMADRMDLAESEAKYRWNQNLGPHDEKTTVPGVSGSTEPFSRAQLAALKEYQRQLFSKWKAEGTDGFDEVEDIKSLRERLERNAEEEAKKLVLIRPALCAKTAGAEIQEVAMPILKKRSIDQALVKPALEVLANEDVEECKSTKAR